jgi:hypothetical protein
MPEFLAPSLSLRPSGPFYDLVVAYLCQVHGFNEIASRGIRAQIAELGPDGIQAMLDHIDDQRTRHAMQGIALGGITGLLAEPALHAEAGERVNVDIAQLARAVVSEHRPALAYLNRLSAGGLLILAWETTEGRHTKDQDWEFLRHCRNAAAHDGRFMFRHGEPRRSAIWRRLEIVRELEERTLFNDGTNRGFLGPGDALHLLSDLEERYFNDNSPSIA